MTSAAVEILALVFRVVWRLFTSWNIPGTNVSPALWVFGFIVIGLFGRFFSRIIFSVDLDSTEDRRRK